MAASRFSLLVFRRTLKLRALQTHGLKIMRISDVFLKRCCSRTAAPNASTSSLDMLITNIVQEDGIEGIDFNTATSVDTLKKLCSQLDGPICSNTSTAILSRFAELANEPSNVQKIANYLKRGLLSQLDESLKDEQLSVNSTLEAMCAAVVLELTQEPIFETLICVLRRHFSTDLFSASISPIVRFASLVKSKKARLPDDLYRQMREWLQLKASEITEPRDIVSVMICWNKNDSWFNMFVEKAKGSISSMSATELVGMMASLANNSSRPPHVLRLICNAFEQNHKSLTINQLIMLAQSTAKLHLMDERLRRLIADETFAKISRLSKWSQINALVNSLAKLRIGDLRTWKAVAAWINNNQMNATTAELSYAVHWCAVAGKGSLIQEAAGFLCEKLNPSKMDSPKTWLSSIYALAMCETLSSELAQTVLQPSFIANVLNGSCRLSGFRRLMVVTTIAQVQLYLKTILNKAYRGPVVNIMDLMELSPTVVDDMALKLRYGKSEEGNVQYFHSLLHKLIPVNSHAFPPALTEDGVFVNAVVKLDVKANRFVPLSHFEETKVPRLAIIYLSWKDSTLKCSDVEKSALMGPVSLIVRLLKSREFVPVLFSQDDFDPSASLKQQFMHIKTKLEDISGGMESR